MDIPRTYVATCPKGAEHPLAEELRALGASDVRESQAVVMFAGPLAGAYRACLWSRCASRVLMPLAEFPAATAEELYAGVAAVPWEEHLAPDGTLAVDANGTTAGLTHTGFVAQKVKDAVVDRLRERTGTRPSVDLVRPDLRLNLHLRRERGTLSLDLSGEPLHRRGYRTPGEQAEAPLKENLAAAILSRAGWPTIAAAGGPLLDPMCGSGTLPLEGAMMAGDRAPGLLRDRWGFTGWLGHDAETWEALLAEADDRAEAGIAALPLIAGWDADPRAVELARGCARRAGLGERVRFEVASLARFAPPPDATPGLVVTNPPHGVRLGADDDLTGLYAQLGERLLDGCEGWRAAVFTADDALARATGLRSERAFQLYNGAIATKLYLFEVSPGVARRSVQRAAVALSPGAEMFANRLRKNVRHLGKWARRQGVTCFRVYDADLPEYAMAIDVYEGAGPDEGRRFAHVQEYAPPPQIPAEKAETRLAEALAVLPDVLGVAPDDVALKVRARQRGSTQYERQAERGEFVEVAEDGLRFLVDPHDHLDTGLFLDHRPVRARLREMASETRFLNLFAYTGAASVHAAAGGAASTTTVDMSATYLDRARRNMALNGFAEGTAHRFVRADALVWMREEAERVASGASAPYDLVFLDPPSFSNSKRMKDGSFDVQRDHVGLLDTASRLLAEGGTLVFSTNLRTFELDASALVGLDVTDITAETIPKDFERNPHIHRCYLVRRTA